MQCDYQPYGEAQCTHEATWVGIDRGDFLSHACDDHSDILSSDFPNAEWTKLGETRRYEVPIIYTGLVTFFVDAKTAEEAGIKAKQAFRNGDIPDLLGNEYESVDRLGEILEVKT